MSAQQDLLAHIAAFRSEALLKADQFAVRASTALTRAVFVGLLLLPLCQPNTFYIVRAGRLGSTAEIELRAGSEAPPSARVLPPAASVPANSEPSDRAENDKSEPDLPASNGAGPSVPALPSPTAEAKDPTKPVPPAMQSAPAWTDAEIATAKQACTQLLGKVVVDTEVLPPAREGICGAPAPRQLNSVGESKVKFEPPATLTCPMIAGLNSWIEDKVQPAARKNFGSPVVRVVAESYSCRNRYGLARAPISEHALMNAVDVSAFVLADGKIIRVSRNWGPTADEVKRAQKSSDASTGDGHAKFEVEASKLGAHDIAKKSDEKEKVEEKPKVDEGEKAKSPEALKEEQAKQAMSAFLHQAHDGACAMFDTVLGPDTNDAHHDHFHLDMKERSHHLTLCE